MIEALVEPVQELAAESPVLLALVALAVFAVAVTVIKVAVRVAVRVGMIAAVALAGYFAIGFLA